MTDDYAHRVQKFDMCGNYISQLGSYGTGQGQFRFSGSIATDSAGNVYVVDAYNFRIQKFDANGGFILQWGGTGNNDGEFGSLGPGTIDVDGSDNVFVGDPSNHRIEIFDSTGSFLTKFGSEGTATASSIGLAALPWIDLIMLYTL